MTSSDVAIDSPNAVPGAKTEAKAKARPIRLVIMIVVAVVVAAYIVHAVIRGRHHVTSDNAQLDGHITQVAPKVQAFVDRVLVDDNRLVKAGDTLVVLDDRDLQLRLAQANADFASASASLGNGARAGQAQAQLQMSQAQAVGATASVASADAAYRKASADLERIRGLAAQKIVPAQALDAAQATYDAARANLEAARGQASAMQSQVSASGAGVSIASARLQAAQAAVMTARLNASYAILVAPVGGVIARRSVEPGALVQVGQPLMSIVPDSAVWVTANLKETQLRKVRIGDSVTFSVDAYPGTEFHGRVSSLSPATGARFALLPPDNATGNFTKVVQRVPVRIDVLDRADPAHPLRPGMSVDVDIETR
ncbi:MAG TPA: HlyD family secretion protein [Gemmatimonadales bacterium]|jgi:membrane fusion protein (multidrug efflux system)